MELLGLILFIIIVYFVLGSKKNKTENYEKRQPNNKETYHHWPPQNIFSFEVVGESFYQENIHDIAEKHATNRDTEKYRDIEIVKAYLIPDYFNPYDSKAVRVDIEGKTVGHLSKENARSFRKRLARMNLNDQITTCNAIIKGGFTVENEKKLSYGIVLDIKPFN